MFPNKSFISVVEEGRETGGSDYLQGQTGNCRFKASVRKRLYSHDFFQINERQFMMKKGSMNISGPL